jgi:D-threo-aldose 1-dehydrogenase
LPLPTTLRPLGRTGRQVTALGLGGAPLGNNLWEVAEEAALATIDAAWEAGIRYFDVAPQYGHGLAEHRFGHVLREHPRDDYVLSTKVGRLLVPRRSGREDSPPFKRPLAFDAVFDYSRDGIIRSFEDSLQRLGINRVDLLFIHNIDLGNHSPERCDILFRQAMEEAYPALDELRRAGLLAGIGVGNNYWEMCQRFAAAGDFDCFMLAGRYTLLEQEALDEFLPMCERRGIPLLIGGPFNSGILATGARDDAYYDYQVATPAILERVSRLEGVCERHGVDLAAAALQFPLQHPAVASVVCGARSAAEISTNLHLMSQPIPADLWAELKTEGLIRSDAPTP